MVASAHQSRVEQIEVGRITGVYGVRGWVRVLSYAHRVSDSVLLHIRRWNIVIKPAQADVVLHNRVTIQHVKLHGVGLVAQFNECMNRETAETFVGGSVWVDRTEFPELTDNEYYWTDLIGLEVLDLLGISLGRVSHLIDNGAHSVLCVLTENGDHEQWIPFVEAHVLEVNLTQRYIRVNWQSELNLSGIH